MVLQRAPASARLWGHVDPQVTVSVVFNNETYGATTNQYGRWWLNLPPTEAGGPYTMTIISSDAQRAQLTDVLFGDVFMVLGDGNMGVLNVLWAFGGMDELASVGQDYTNIRYFQVDRSMTDEPLSDFRDIRQHWTPAETTSVATFGAACWYFARSLYDLLSVPIGIVNLSAGGAQLPCLLSPVAVEEADARCGPRGYSCVFAKNTTNWGSQLYNGMISPVRRMAFKGVVLYHGGDEPTPTPHDAERTTCMWPIFVRDLRRQLQNRLPVIYTQYHGFDTNDLFGKWRIGQVEQGLNLPHTGFASAVDLGDPTIYHDLKIENVHTRHKKEIGRRLANAAGSVIYGMNTTWLGPFAVSAELLEAETRVTFKIDFDPSSTTGGLVWTDASCPEFINPKLCSGYEIVWPNGRVVQADAKLSGMSLLISVPSIKSGALPVLVQHGVNGWPLNHLYNGAGLPQTPFIFNVTEIQL